MSIAAFKKVNSHFFKTWTPEMSYILGFIVADGCVSSTKERPNSLTVNITSADKPLLIKIRKAINSEHKISQKYNSSGDRSYQIQFRNQILARDLIDLGI